MSYITINNAIDGICKFGPGVLLAKLDIKNEFHQLPVHPASRHLLAMLWLDWVYIRRYFPSIQPTINPKVIEPFG